MKKGINYWSFPDETPLQKAAELAKDAGFDGIEFVWQRQVNLVCMLRILRSRL